MILLGRDAPPDSREGASFGTPNNRGYPVAGHLGACLARDGSTGADVHIDLDSAHAGVVVGKRGYGKSYTLGVLAEALAEQPGTTPVVFDPMGAFSSLADEIGGATHVEQPMVQASAVSPEVWPALLDLSPTGAVGGLIWRVASEANTLSGMRALVEDATVEPATRRASANHLALAADWNVFDPSGVSPESLLDSSGTVLDCRHLDAAPMNALAFAVAEGVYAHCVRNDVPRLPWLLVDESHAFFDGIAGDALETVLTQGRAPGVSLVAATQRPSAVPPVAISQSDLVVAHRLTAADDRAALSSARPSYVDGTLTERLPTEPGQALLLDDATEAVHVIHVRERRTTHDGESATVRQRLEESVDSDEQAAGTAGKSHPLD